MAFCQVTPKEFAKYVAREGGGCIHCGETEAISPNHRSNRGMGGSKVRDVPSNIVVLCSAMNQAIESDLESMLLAKNFGWKLNSWENPEHVAVWDSLNRVWKLLDNKYNFKIVEGKNNEPK